MNVKILQLLFSFLVGFTESTIAQRSFSGIVKDAVSGNPLPYAHIYFEDRLTGTVSNVRGEFKLVYKSEEITVPLVIISSIGYQSLFVDVSKFSSSNNAFTLNPLSTRLNEVVVKPVVIKKLIDSVIVRIPKNYDQGQFVVSGFQREFIIHDSEVIQLIEAAFRTTRSNELESTEIIHAVFMEDKAEKEDLWNASRGGFYTLGWTAISGIENLTSESFLGVTLPEKNTIHKYYTFDYIERVELNGEAYLVIEFDQKTSVKMPLLKGKLFIDEKSLAIQQIEYELSPSGLKYLKPHKSWGGRTLSKPPKKIEIRSEKSKMTYVKNGEKWYLHSKVMDAVFDASLTLLGATLSSKDSLQFHSEQLISSIDTEAIIQSNTDQIGRIPTIQNYIKKEFEDYSVYDSLWTDFNIIMPEFSSGELAAEIKKKNDKWELNNSKDSLERDIERTFTRKQLKDDIDLLQETLENVHPGYDWYTSSEELKLRFDNVRNLEGRKFNEIDFFKRLAPLIASINCGHTELLPSASRERYLDLSAEFPIQLEIQNETAIASEINPWVPVGSRVLSINNEAIESIIETIKQGISSDGYNETYKNFRLAQDFPRLLSLHYPLADTFSVVFESNQDKEQLNIPGKISGVQGKEKNAFISLDSLNTGILRVASFYQDEQTYQNMLHNSFRSIKKKGIENLIIDLRGNSGGRDDNGAMLFSYLVDQPFDYYDRITLATADSSMLNRLKFGDLPFSVALPNYLNVVSEESDGNLTYTEHENLKVQTPAEGAFLGRVYLLVDGGTFSAASEFVSIARSNERATIIGEETGGGYYGNCSLGTPVLVLPNSGLRVTVPLGRYHLAVSNNTDKGRGVIPDHFITKGSIMSDNDELLRFAIELIAQGE